MFGSRRFVVSTNKQLVKKKKGNQSEVPFDGYVKRLMEQSKKISQVIAYIWLNENDPTAAALDQYFKAPAKLDDLLFAQPGSKEYDLLKPVFRGKENALPIFDLSERPYYTLKVIFDQFEGSISDASLESEEVLTMWIPYPPRPQIVDDSHLPQGQLATAAPLKTSELQDWINQPSDQPPYYYETNPYIPTTCS